MKISVVTPHGELYNEDIEYVVVSSKMNGEFAIMKDHIPIISSVDIGYVKMVRDGKELFTVIINGVVEHNNNIINVIAQEAHVGLSKDSALDHLNTVREERIRENKRRNVDFAKAERELKKNVKEAKAGHM
ncbi:ATP synthase F1 subunit epsilon [Candidatus Xianfuyuplasma coldseepsis]|uniref:ATP synthase epsilon chain n=1 Tax=Candidatus Xianfuyuplasma coldseepsis TaxID=2782163 RepID=A0A7L7KSP4_9MOLU|nr:ATP synthase F1 subunit epsilon [Xianfuyuplasma coldseepsis]QMS85429.1 ATP synthase F1 subunit epsilon [Xianfuyuplasma coldseepsis]